MAIPGASLPLQRALLLLIATTLLVGLISAGTAIDRRLAHEIEARARRDLAQAPRLLADRNAAVSDGLVMHAKSIAQAPGLAEALLRGDSSAAVRAARSARGSYGDAAVVVTRDGRAWDGPPLAAPMAKSTMTGEIAVAVVSDSTTLNSVALASIIHRGQWLGAAGVSVMLGQPAAGVLAASTRSDVLIVAASGIVTASTLPDSTSQAVANSLASVPSDETVHALSYGVRRLLVVSSAFGGAGRALFVHDLTRDLEVLPRFRGVIAASGVAALAVCLLLGTIAAIRIARPVRALADAADRLAAGDVNAPLMPSAIREIGRMSDAFGEMRLALVARMDDALRANRELGDRQLRLEGAQSELLQRERFAVSSRLLAEMSHEIRNPIANVRNCLEIIRRRVGSDPEALEFTELAIDELLRMHELAEQMLDLNRPRDPVLKACHATTVARETAALVTAGMVREQFAIHIESDTDPLVAIAPDSLKQVLLNLLQNAREAVVPRVRSSDASAAVVTVAIAQHGDTVTIDVTDTGPGISQSVLPHVFDPFFTTKGAARGVGLGLFVANGLVRSANGQLTAANRRDALGAWFHIELPVAVNDDAMAHAERA